ncbi:MAG: hypothetical protein H0W62_03025 [Chitinophagales bacterium]|nr:hypothetical protein [Chitinophagales bacterium]
MTGLRIFIVAVSTFLYSFSIAQPATTYSGDPSAFQKEINDLLNQTKRDDAKQTSNDFAAVWSSFPQDKQSDIMAIASAMQSSRMAGYPYFVKYINTIATIEKNSVSDQLWQQWKTVLLFLITRQKSGSNKSYETFLDFSLNLFSQNILYAKQERFWKISSKDYSLQIRDDTPVLTISNINLSALSAGDSIRIMQTNGTYYPLDNKWIGENGRVDWTRAGLPAEEVYVNFTNYQIDLSKTEYVVDSALLNFSSFSKKNVVGKFSDKLFTDYNKETASYPRFDSYQKDLSFQRIASNVQLTAGISLQGATMSASGTNDQKAIIKIQRYDNKVGLIARSTAFEIKNNKISSMDAEVNITLNTDSLYHGGATMRYDILTRQLLLLRGASGIAKTPFRDFYHKTDIFADVIFWDMSKPNFYIRNLTTAGQTSVSYESFNYFDKSRLEKYQNLADYNILEKIKTIAEKSGQREFDASDLAKRIEGNYSEETLKGIYYKLVEDGFIKYEQRGLVTVLDKAFFYVNANKKLVNYDNIQLSSQTDTVNGQMDLRNLNLRVGGVSSIPLSDSNFVIIFPRKDSLLMKQNRNIDFSGRMFAGWLDMNGSGFKYNYDSNQMNLSKVDSLIINIPTGKFDEKHQPVLGPIKSTIENVTGSLQVDSKSSTRVHKKNPQFPIITTTKPSYIYYDNPGLFNGSYKRTKFYLQLDPFILDSLNNLQVSKVAFDGKLVSAGIFPEIKDHVSIQPDLSLGFKITKMDLPLYGGKGSYSKEIILNNSGLKGKGTIKFLSSTTQSREIIFLPDSLLAKADSFSIAASLIGKTEFPNVKGSKGTILWRPSHDSMIVKTDSIPFKIFDEKSSLKGTVVLRSTGMRGSGTVDWSDAILSSRDILFAKNRMSADTADFYIKSKDPKQPSLRTNNVKAKIDFDKRTGEFKSNTNDIATVFPYNQYRTSISEFRWDMDNNKMTFNAPQGSSALFTSTNPEQDSLSFTGSGAIYDMKQYVLKINKVPYITVADAKIFPDSGKITIEGNAAMRTLTKAKITMDTASGFHKFDSVTATIYGRRELKVTAAIYNYINRSGKPQKIRIDDMGIFKDTADHQLHIYAKGGVDTAMQFQLLPKISYKGRVNVVSNIRDIALKGYAKLDINNPNIRAEWFSVNGYVSKDSNYVYFNDPVNESHKPVTAGIVFDADSSDLYTSFFNAKKSYRDKNLFTANGMVYYDEKLKQYIAGNPDKILRNAVKGNVLKYSDATGKVAAEGKMDMSLNFGLVKINAAGSVSTDVIKNDFLFNLMLGIQFDIDKDLVVKFSKDVIEGNYDAAEASYQSDAFQKNIAELIVAKNEKSFNEQFASTNSFSKSKALPYTILISDVEMKWDKTSRSFYSTKPFSIAFINDKSVAKVVKGYLELGYKRSGDYMNLYIPAGADDWYFFNYASGNMQIASGDEAFNTALEKIKPDKRTAKSDESGGYQYNPGSENKKNTFINRIKFLQSGSSAPAPKQTHK